MPSSLTKCIHRPLVSFPFRITANYRIDNNMAKKGINSTSKKTNGVRVELKGLLTQGRSQSYPKSDFIVQRHGPTILLQFTVPEAQHLALFRMESLYKSKSDAQPYVPLQNPGTKLLCRNYQAFNLPISSIYEWFQAMQKTEKNLCQSQGNLDIHKSLQGWWSLFTNSQESRLLDHLWQFGCLRDIKPGEVPSYLISVTYKSVIQHEISHAFYFLHPGYGHKVHQLWMGLSKKIRLIISHNLLMRGYGQHVWVDEFQAYVSEDRGEFENKTKQECDEALLELRAAQSSTWKERDLNVQVFSSQGILLS